MKPNVAFIFPKMLNVFRFKDQLYRCLNSFLSCKLTCGASVYLPLKVTFYCLLVLHQVLQMIMVNIIKEIFRVLADLITSLDLRLFIVVRIVRLIHF